MILAFKEKETLKVSTYYEIIFHSNVAKTPEINCSPKYLNSTDYRVPHYITNYELYSTPVMSFRV